MQNLRIFLEDIFKYLPEKLNELGISGTDTGNIYQQVINKVGGEDNFLDFLMGFLNLLYENFDMYFFKGFTEPSLLYHISRKEDNLKKLIENLYADKIEISPKDFYLSKLKKHKKEKVLEVLDLYVKFGNLAPEVYKHYEKEDILDKREKEIAGKYPILRQVKEVIVKTEKKEYKARTEDKEIKDIEEIKQEIKKLEKEKTKKDKSSFVLPFSILGIFLFGVAGIALISVFAKFTGLFTKLLKR